MILCFGLLRPYKGVDVLLEAFAGSRAPSSGSSGCRGWPSTPLRRLAERCRGTVRFVAPLRHRPRDPGLLPPRRPRRAALPGDRAVRRPLHGARLRQADGASAVGGFAEVGERDEALRARARPATPRRLPRRSSELLADPAARERLAAAARARRSGPVLVGRRSPRGRWRSTASSWTDNRRDGRARDRLLGLGRAARLHPPRLPAAAAAPLARLRAAGRRRPPAELPSVSLIVAAHDEEDVIAAKVANALALDYPRERLEVIVASDGSADRTVELAREAGADLVLELAAGGKVARPERRRRARHAARCSPSPTRTRSGSPTRCASWSPRSPTRRSATSAARCALDAGRRQPGGRLLALRDGGPRARVAASPGSPPATARSTRSAATPTSPLGPASQPRPLVPVRARQARLARRLRARRRSPRRRWSPTIEGEFAPQAADDERALGRWSSATGCSPRAATARCTRSRSSRHRLLRYASPLLHLVALAANIALLGAGRGLRGHARRPARAARRRGARRAFVPLRRFRIARYYVLMTASIAAGLWDRLRARHARGWEKAEGTR